MLPAFLILMPLQLLPAKQAHAASNVVLRGWSYIWAFTVFIYFIRKNPRVARIKGPAVIVSNHGSFLDTPAVYTAVRLRFKTLAKKSLLKVPVMGAIFKTSGIMVDRSSAESRRQSYERMEDAIHAGTSVLIFPEGTQNRGDRRLNDFYPGAFRLAVATGKPVIPMVCINNRRLMPQGNPWKMRPGVIKIHFLPPVETAGLGEEDVDALSAKVHKMMDDKIAAVESGSKKK